MAQRILFINAVGFAMFITFSTAFIVSFGRVKLRYAIALSLGLLSVLILGMAGTEGRILRKRTF
jgi:Na+/H+-dicarboxylate symporter